MVGNAKRGVVGVPVSWVTVVWRVATVAAVVRGAAIRVAGGAAIGTISS